MGDIFTILLATFVFFGALALRGLFGYIKNHKADSSISFSWQKFLTSSAWTGLKIGGVGLLAALLVVFLWLVNKSGVQVAGIDQISVNTLLIGILIADVGVLGMAIKEALSGVFRLTEQQVTQIQEVAANASKNGSKLGADLSLSNGAVVAIATEVRQDRGTGTEDTEDTLKQMGAFPYYKVDVSSPDGFYNAVNGKGFDEGYGYQCVAGFKEFQYAQSGRIVATSTGGASGYASQRSQIEPLGFTYLNDGNLQNGDWVIFGGGQYGHVAMYYNGRFFGQNQGASNPNVGNPFNLSNVGLPYLCHYRPNQFIAVTPPKPTPDPTPAPNGDVRVGSIVRPIRAVSYDGVALASFVTERDYPVIEVVGDRAVLGSINTAFQTGNLTVISQPVTKIPVTHAPNIGDRVTTTATTDQNGKNLNMAVINDGQSVWSETNAKGNAVLTKGGVVRAGVPVNSLSKV